MITTAQIDAALAGTDPVGSPMTAKELGLALQKHRRRSHRPYSESTVLTYRVRTDMQSDEFTNAFWSWYAAKTLRQEQFAKVKFDGLTADDLLAEQGRIVILGSGPVILLIGVAHLPDGSMIHVNGSGSAGVVETTAPIVGCAVCGRPVAQRSWNHRFCTTCKPKRSYVRNGRHGESS